MSDSFLEMQKDLCDASLKARGYIRNWLESYDSEHEKYEKDMLNALQRLDWALGGISLGNFMNEKSIFPEGLAKMDPWGAHAPFHLLDGDGPNQTWAWEAYRMINHSTNMQNWRMDVLPMIILMAKKDIARGVDWDVISNISSSDRKIIESVESLRLNCDLIDRINRSDANALTVAFGYLEDIKLMTTYENKTYACVIDGFGVGPNSYSLFDAASLAECVLDGFQTFTGRAEDEELSLLIRNIGIRLKHVEHMISGSYKSRGEELWAKICKKHWHAGMVGGEAA